MKDRMNFYFKLLPAFIGMLLNLLSFAQVIAAFVLKSTEVPPATGVSRSFAAWADSFLIAFISIFLYLVDLNASFSALKFCKKLLIIKTVFVICAIPLVLLVGSQLGVCILIWNIYYLVLFLVELISFVKICFRSYK